MKYTYYCKKCGHDGAFDTRERCRQAEREHARQHRNPNHPELVWTINPQRGTVVRRALRDVPRKP